MARDPAFRGLLDRYERLDALIKAGTALPNDVDWVRLRERIAAAVRGSGGELSVDDGLDGMLRGLGGLDERVDWDRLKDRISVAVDRESGTGPRSRRRRWSFVALAASGLTAAAVLVIALLPKLTASAPVVEANPVVELVVGAPVDEAMWGASSVADFEIGGGDADGAVVRFFSVDPVPWADRGDESAGFY